ncbi:MAG: response regulator transcription factor [Lachnospiraceae bacterium]
MIYCVEDDENIRKLVVYTLGTAGIDACGYEDGRELKEALAAELPELILLDIMLPGEDGMLLLHQLKETIRTKDIPVIMVTAKGSEYDRVVGLDNGADDYISKPFGMMELVARIKAVLRRTGRMNPKKVISIANLTLDCQKHEVRVGGDAISLTKKEFALLERLMFNQNIVLTRDQLLVDIWGYDFDGETRTVDVHIRTLRQKLGTAGTLIETVRGIGYRVGDSYEA